MKHSVKLFTLLYFFCLNCFVLKAQQKHFIYVQSEDKQPFAVVLGGKVYSSSDYGYVIVPKLVDSTYKFTVSFPMNKFPDQVFTSTINKKDAGYILKNGTDGWALQNMQTQKIIVSSTAAAAQKNAFSDMLSDVVSDSTLTKNNNVQQPVVAATAVAGSAAVISATGNAANSTGIITDSIQGPEKISETKLDTGTNMLFVDKTQTGIDTINVFIPAETTNNNVAAGQNTLPDNSAVVVVPAVINNTSSQNNVPSVSANITTNDTASNADTTAQPIANPFYKPEQSASNTVANSAATTVPVAAATSNAIKQDCSNMISDNDLDKLKRKMFMQHNDNDMIQYAIKYLNKKCITTDQVKLLGSLFSSDDGRYSLYDALYNSVYDYGNYPALSSEIVDPYYKKRFAAMLR